MSAVLVAVPFAKGKARIHFWKGRVWSFIEHLVLDVLTRETLTVAQLADGFRLPRRVVTECLIRLMRIDWLHMTQSADGLRFAATPAGSRAAAADELPAAGRKMSRAPTYYYDRIVGHVFRARGLRVVDGETLKKRYGKGEIRWIEPRVADLQFDLSEFAHVMLDDDERIIQVDNPTENWANKYVVVSVRGDSITGLPEGDYPALSQAILADVGHPKAAADSTGSVDPSAATRRPRVSKAHRIAFDRSDLILGGPAHGSTLERVLKNAQSRIILHSTFINPDKVMGLLPLFRAAIARGVAIDILWGQNDDLDRKGPSGQEIASTLAQTPEIARLDGFVIHPWSTRSHSKWILADAEPQGAFGLVMGSCNWLSSSFHRAEASICLRDPSILSEFMLLAVEMSRATNGLWNSLTNEFLRLHWMIGASPGPTNGNAKAAFIVDEQHDQYVLKARDEARERIFLTSHRLGPSARPGILVPLMEACRAGSVRAEVHFGRFDRIKNLSQAQWVAEASEAGVEVMQTGREGLHAKVLGWDDHALVISSLNWLSAHPAPFRAAREIGVWVEAPGITSEVISALIQTPKN
jgi:cardiolipin synthase